ncbi:MAG TPA: efflux RND transporter permease subunit [Candidatus Methylomirabilis sp.]|nr:efflux RND transporter permease subunit [Candidatus Methylomirabilis sp.]
MWIVRVALERPYTFIVLALLILLLSPVVVSRMPTDIFPTIDIPIVAAAWTYSGMNAEELEGRITTPYERSLTTTVDNIEHIESSTVAGQCVVKVFLQPRGSVDTANAQVTAISQNIQRQLPAGTLPPLIINYSASSVPILQLGLSGAGLTEAQLYDLAANFLRPQLATVAGAAIPYPYGGKQRQIMVDLNGRLLQSKLLSPADVLTALEQQNVILPAGTVKIGRLEYDVGLNSSPRTVAELNDLPVKVVGNATIYLRDVGYVRDGFAVQTNIVRQEGRRGTLLTVYKTGSASTLAVVSGIRHLLPKAATTLPPELKIEPLADQSIFVRAAISGVIREAIIAACLTGVMILLFLGSWRSTLIIAVSIPLSILSSVVILGFLGETINIMTLGGLALAVGILVDDATVTIENIERHIEDGHELNAAILNGAAQIAVPALVSTLCICIVFLPMFSLTGVARYLFVPLAEAVVFAMLSSYVLSRTLIPTLGMYLLRAQAGQAPPTRNPLALFQRGFERVFERVRQAYRGALTRLVGARLVFVPLFILVCLSAAFLVPWLGENFFPDSDSGHLILHLRAKTGTRIEETARLTDLVENVIREEIPDAERGTILDNIGLPYSTINHMYATSGVIGAGDADILVSLRPGHRPTADHVRRLRRRLPRDFPGAIFYFLPADIITQTLNFGLPSPIDIQIQGDDLDGNRRVADRMLSDLRRVPGLVDLRIQQDFDYPMFNVKMDRTKAASGGLTPRDVAQSVVLSLSGSFQIAPNFFLDWHNGVVYPLVAQAPQYTLESLHDLENISLTSTSPGSSRPAILADVASIARANEPAVVSHYNIRRVIDIFGAIQGRDLGGVSRDVARIVEAHRPQLPRGSFTMVRGQTETMRTSYEGLLGGLAFAIVLVYLLIVVNFQSWLDAFIIITALPAALAGIVVFLFVTGTTLSVPALMGAIMCMGVGTANSILVIAFARERLAERGDAAAAAVEAGFTRFRPVLMTALAMIIGMIPMALGLGDGGEQNAPLGRAVIGGLLTATTATLLFVPSVFSLVHGRRRAVGSAPARRDSGARPA